jgi:hypothetical protein
MYGRGDRSFPGGNMPGPPGAPLRHSEAISAPGDFNVLQICPANLRESWLKRAAYQAGRLGRRIGYDTRLPD